MQSLELKKDLYWIGALDPNLRVFDIIMHTPFGTTYNSYLVKGSEKIAVFETVKEQFFDEYLEHLNSLNIDLKSIDYIIVDHTEPDHAGSVRKLLDIAKNATVVGSSSAIEFLKEIVNEDFKYIEVTDGDTLSLGNKTLEFISVPLLHWPDTMYTYIKEDNVLITCDSFGAHYCTDKIFNDLIENNDDYMEALNYYFNAIMGPFKKDVLYAIDKIKDLKIDMICPGHGPVLRDNPQKIVDLYKEWSTIPPKAKDKFDVTICYVSAYGYTASLAEKIKEGLENNPKFSVNCIDVIKDNLEDILEKINISEGVLFGTPTINGDALKPIWDILTCLNPLVHGYKVASAFGSFGWSGEGVPNVMERLNQVRMLTLPPLKVSFKPTDEDLTTAYKFGENFARIVEENSKKASSVSNSDGSKKLWKCTICGQIFSGDTPPDICPACGATSDQFIEVKEEIITFKSDKKEDFLIIGNGIAGLYAAEAIRKRNCNCNIEIISSEPYLTYYRPSLSDGIFDELQSDFFIKDENWYKENNIKVTLNTKVEKIFEENHEVLTCDNKKVKYDKLILANGSRNFIPPVKGKEGKNVFTLRTLDDLKTIKSHLSNAKDIVIIGGGLLGLEAAYEFKRADKNVTVVEFAPHLLSRQLDATGSLLLEESVKNCDVEVLLGVGAESISDKNDKKVVSFNNGTEKECDLVLFSVGIMPNKEIAQDSTLTCNRGIVVNDKMETSSKDIYACGDIAELNGRVYGNWPAAIDMGTIAGANAVGDNVTFVGFQSPIMFNAMNTQVFSCGNISENIDKSLQFKDESKKTYKKLFFKNDILVGAILIGDILSSVKILNAIDNYKTIDDVLKDGIL